MKGSYLLVDGIPPWDDDRWPAERKWKPSDEKDWRSMFPDQLFVEFARTVAWGNQPTAHALKLEHVTDPKFAPEYRFMPAGERTAAVLVNWSDAELPFALECPDGSAEGVLPARSWRKVDFR